MADDPYSVWCRENGCTHGHCEKYNHEHPQPFGIVMNGETRVRIVCGYCWFKCGELTDVVPCSPEICE